MTTINKPHILYLLQLDPDSSDFVEIIFSCTLGQECQYPALAYQNGGSVVTSGTTVCMLLHSET